MHTKVHSRHFSKSRHKLGFTLTEIAIVLGVIGTILSAIWTAASHVSNNQKTTKAVQEVLTIAEGVKALFPLGNIVGGAQSLSASVINQGIAPSDAITSCAGLSWPAETGTAGCAVNPWHGQIIVGSQGGWGGLAAASNRFEITTNLPTAASCAAFLSAIVPQATSGGSLVAFQAAPFGVVAANANYSVAGWAACTGGEVDLQFQL